jgi:hypothetical protein
MPHNTAVLHAAAFDGGLMGEEPGVMGMLLNQRGRRQQFQHSTRTKSDQQATAANRRHYRR